MRKAIVRERTLEKEMEESSEGFTPVARLSYGERAWLVLARLVLSSPPRPKRRP